MIKCKRRHDPCNPDNGSQDDSHSTANNKDICSESDSEPGHTKYRSHVDLKYCPGNF